MKYFLIGVSFLFCAILVFVIFADDIGKSVGENNIKKIYVRNTPTQQTASLNEYSFVGWVDDFLKFVAHNHNKVDKLDPAPQADDCIENGAELFPGEPDPEAGWCIGSVEIVTGGSSYYFNWKQSNSKAFKFDLNRYDNLTHISCKSILGALEIRKWVYPSSSSNILYHCKIIAGELSGLHVTIGNKPSIMIKVWSEQGLKQWYDGGHYEFITQNGRTIR